MFKTIALYKLNYLSNKAENLRVPSQHIHNFRRQSEIFPLPTAMILFDVNLNILLIN